MKIGCLVHFSLPHRCAGSEVVMHELMKAAVAAGHEAIVWCTHKDAATSWRGHEPDEMVDGILVKRVRNSLIGAQRMKAWRPDVVFSHHQHTLIAQKTAKQVGARFVFATHNDYDLNKRPLQARPDLVIHNSRHVAESLSRFGNSYESMIFHPPLTPDRHRVPSTGDAYTLINLNRDKGSDLFYRLAQSMPERKFVGVIGGHGEQVVRRGLPNVEILDHGPDMGRVWSRTRVLLMPSQYESYGLTAVEAGVNGIPTIAHPTTGLQENLGPDGLYADRDSISEWVHHLERLDIPDVYAAASEHAAQVSDAAMKETRDTLKSWLQWLG